MSLYHEAAKILDGSRKEGTSIKSLVYTKKDWKSDPKALFALSTEAAKWSEVLSEVLERSGVPKIERQLSPTLALVLTYDLFLSRRGVALPATHGLNAAVSKHKARLSAELTKARLRRGYATLDALRVSINEGSATTDKNGEHTRRLARPRWVRINTLRTTLAEQLASTFADYQEVATLSDVTRSSSAPRKVYHLDDHVPNLIAIPNGVDITATKAYRTGLLILQDKASCFPAYLLSPHADVEGDAMDACAAPGNKTTHLAAVLAAARSSDTDGKASGKIFACEKDATRSETLEKMVKLAGAGDLVTVKAKQDFTKLYPDRRDFAYVTALLLDPSCSGSGIVSRDEGSGITLHLPSLTSDAPASKGKKRKRTDQAAPKPAAATLSSTDLAELAEAEEAPPESAGETADKLAARLANLSAFQLRLLQHAMAFPAARRIAYSTCSIHAEENEHVVVAALRSGIAREQGWRVMRRAEQVEGLQKWQLRGQREAVSAAVRGSKGNGVDIDVEEVAEACVRCDKNGEDGTMGFFVVGFVRNGANGETNGRTVDVLESDGHEANGSADEDEEEEWEGFDDET